MNKFICHTLSPLMILLLQLSYQPLVAQTNRQMIMFQIDGNNYIKKSYDKNSSLKSSQVFKVGMVIKEQLQYTVPLKIYNYDKKGNLIDSLDTRYTCKPTDHQILMNVFPFASLNRNKTVTVKLNSKNALYPEVWKTGQKIPDVDFDISLDGGILGTLGTDSKVKIYNRKIAAHDTVQNTYSVIAQIQVRTYMFGLNVDTKNYVLRETVHPKKGIIRQYFKQSTGEYFIIELEQQ